MRRLAMVVVVFGLCFCLGGPVLAQSTNASITGYVTDPTKAVLPGAKVIAINVGTNVRYEGPTNGTGSYLIPNLPPGYYRIEVEKTGFKTVVKSDVLLHVQDAIAINFEMAVGSTSETVTVEGGAPLVNTQDAAVSTVVDRRFVENMPLNGRSFQTLIALTPGVVLTPTNNASLGQFSVNGQRADSNYFSVDGVSANVGTVGAITSNLNLYQTAGGATPAFSALGGTNSLVSVDAMEEFRIQTSSVAPEFGSTPGGQIAIATRSGTNNFHGTLFEYFRNDVLDANDWFANNKGLKKPEERQNDFGGVLGGPIVRDRTFFFFSYEGLRLRQPLTAQTSVPDGPSRQAAVASMQPFLNAYPVANGAVLGNGLAQFNASYSNPASLNAYSIRLDHVINSKLSIFGRYNYSPSETVQRGTQGALSSTLATEFALHTFTLGLTQRLANNLINDTRVNYSNSRVSGSSTADNFGGATPLSTASVFPSSFSPTSSHFSFFISGPGGIDVGKNSTGEQRQVNLVDNLSVTTGAHQLKFGVDYRWLAPFTSPISYSQQPFFFSVPGAVSGVAPFVNIGAFQDSALLSRNLSVYGQDTWKVTARLTLTYGVRWEVNPALKGKNAASDPFTVQGLNNPATMTLAPRGTALYGTTYGNVAPRIGVTYQLRQAHGWETVFRGGFGVFYDFGTGSLGALTGGFPFLATKSVSAAAFPLTAQQAAPPAISPSLPITSSLFVADPNLTLPRTYQWNAATEQSLGGPNQTISVTYLGAVGRDLLRVDTLFHPSVNFAVVDVTRNSSTSDYHALQVKFRRRLSRGLQALASYSLSHSLDTASSDWYAFNTPASVATFASNRGDSDFDVRHSLTGAVSYDLPGAWSHGVARALLGGWSVDDFVTARSALPVTVTGPISVFAGTIFQSRPNVVPGQPFYIIGSQCLQPTPVGIGHACPGGKAFNSAAFANVPTGQQGNLRRNALRGFGAWQTDLALRRQFRVTEKLGLQFRAELFNIFNHPNFGSPSVTQIGLPLFGQSTQMLASSLSVGTANGFNPLYQVGGPRSVQFALKLTF